MLYIFLSKDHIAYFKQNFNKKPLKKSYFKDAMEHFREESTTKAIAFLYISDDMEWGRTHLKSVKKKYNDLFFIGKIRKNNIFHQKRAA